MADDKWFERHQKLMNDAQKHLNNASDTMDSIQSHLSEMQTGTPVPRPKPKGPSDGTSDGTSPLGGQAK